MLTIQNFRTSFRQIILKRELDYVRQGRVHDLTRTPDGTVSATVSGSHDYPVRMQLSPQRNRHKGILRPQQSKADLSNLAVGGEADITKMSADEILKLLE
ncbi:MAG: hypothetical protein SOZ51_08375 [Eubacteriales bacterium]|nr:hypothetical protein [Eubacteriales bacterium]